MRLIEEFFKTDGKIYHGFIRKSVLLQILRDLRFNLGIGREEWLRLRLTDEQNKTREKIIPLLTPVLLFCSGIDLLARAEKKSIPNTRQSGIFFKEFCKYNFNLDDDEARVLWNFRNALTHQYKLPKGVVLNRAGNQKFIIKVSNQKLYFIYVRSMYSSLNRAKENIFEKLRGESKDENDETKKFIQKHGFILQRVDNEVKLPTKEQIPKTSRE